MSDDDCIIIEDNTNYKSITCEQIPELFLDKLVAKNHFGKYGKISRFVLRPNRLSCTVDYEREEEAANAIENGNVFNGHEFTIRHSQREVGHVQRTEEWVDPDVQAELDAMGNHARRMPIPVSKLPPPAPRVAKHKPPRAVPEPMVSQAPRIPNAVQSELEAILRKPAYTDEDKYRILDARDKLIRLNTVRTTDISKVVSIKGTCPDMCPEKERYMREFQHQVSNFEMEDESNRLDHNIAIKEYSRSSADQEVPLVHELRPEPVLKMTMLYLMHNIMGLCDIEEVNTGDWFHFVWDRTRSIRKDITQQELCSTGAVQLVEQCARFHIHCAARLVAEDPSVFDQKINTENLTKCLQTLKYMYNDLRIKGIRCENEAEFRGYIVLLNLNDANFLWELQNLPDDIQNSKEVRSTIAFYKCMESNNYVRFFNLVRETTYMNACILLRYFTQVRMKALKMIIKAYNWPRHLVSLPLEYLTKILGFESDDAAVDFFSDCGLDCDSERVRLDKNAFEEPDVPFLLNRAFEIVESKRQVGVGQAVCGQPLDSCSIFENHQPHDSFDANGYLRYEAFTAEDQFKGEGIRKTPPRTQSDNIFKVPVMSAPMTPKQQLKSIFASVSPKMESGLKPLPAFGATTSSVLGSIFNQKTSTQGTSSTTSSIFKIPLPAPPVQAPTPASPLFMGSAFNQNSVSSGNIFGGYTNDMVPTKETNSTFGSTSTAQPFSSDSIFRHFDAKPLEFEVIKPQFKDSDLEQQTELQRKREELQERLRKIEEEKVSKIKEQEELERQRQLEEEHQYQKRLEEKRRKAAVARVAQNSEIILSELLDEVEDKLLAEVANEEVQRHLKHESLAENVIFDFIAEYIKQIHSEELTIWRRDQSLVYRYFHAWRDLTHKKKTQRELIARVPVWMTTETLDEQAEKMAHPRQAENLHMIKRYRLGFPCDFRTLLEYEEQHRPIDIFKCLLRYFRSKENQTHTGFLKRRKYFKLVLSLPGERDELPGFNSFSNNWLEKNVERKFVESTPAFVCHCEDDLALCVRKVSYIVPRNEENQRVSTECDHADGVLFFMSPGNFMNSRKRLHHLLKLTDLYRALPVAILAFNVAEDASIEAQLELASLVDDGKISSFYVLRSNDCFLKRDFQRALGYLATYDKFDCSLEAQSVAEFINTCLGSELWQRLQKSWSINPSFRKICSIPRLLVAVYNEAVDHLINIIDEDFQDYPEFPEELRQFVPQTKFENPVSLEQFPVDWKDVNRTKKLISFLRKLKLPSIKVDLPREIDSLEIWLLNYTSACIADNDEMATKAGYHAIKCLIDELNNEGLEDLQVEQRLNLISWLPIIREAALAILNYQWNKGNHRLPLQIIYNREEFLEFLSEPWWLDSELVKSVKMTLESGGNDIEEQIELPEDIDAIIARAEKASFLADEKLQKLQKEMNSTTAHPELTRELDEALYNFEVNEKCRSFDIPPLDENDDSLELPPVAKKFKESSDKMDIEQIMQRAFAIIKKAEVMMDGYRRPMKVIQSFETE